MRCLFHYMRCLLRYMLKRSLQLYYMMSSLLTSQSLQSFWIALIILRNGTESVVALFYGTERNRTLLTWPIFTSRIKELNKLSKSNYYECKIKRKEMLRTTSTEYFRIERIVSRRFRREKVSYKNSNLFKCVFIHILFNHL